MNAALRPRLWAGTTAASVPCAVAILATAMAVTTQPSFVIFILNSVWLAAIGAYALNLLMGTAGQVSIGNTAFLVVGAFTAVAASRAGLGFPGDLAVAMLAAGGFGFCVGLPALRIRGIYLVLATLAAHFIALFLAERYQADRVESAGFNLNPVFSVATLVGKQRAWACTLLVVLLLVILLCSWLQHGRSGRAWRMIRDRETAAHAMGIEVAGFKLLAFVISAALIGLQGALGAHFAGNVSTEGYTLTMAIACIAMILIGGLDSVAGPLIGAAVVTILPFATPALVGLVLDPQLASQYAARIAQIIYGLLIILFIARARTGVNGWFSALAARIRNRATVDS